ncbi:hypothetical protein [Cellulomonas sp. KRMCY2]|uniref:hypothetical protein n=1 Tax=Cellulomonas sp. KRMCY2 TaxID=1304865 RepID=UPI00045E8029|nr:hypothetical protein [Cellulomonas sp. KRMCY2]
MTALGYQTRTTSVRLPLLRLGRYRGSVVLELTELTGRLEQGIERHRRWRAADRFAAARSVERAEQHRAAAIAQRMSVGL